MTPVASPARRRGMRSTAGVRLPEPVSPWVLHTTPRLGNLTERWIELQVNATDRFDSRLYGPLVAGDFMSDGMTDGARWIVPAPWSAAWLAYRGMFRTDGLSPVYLARQFRRNRPAVIHVHYGPPAAQLTLFAKVLERPLVASFYGFDASVSRFREQWIWRRRYARLFRRAAAFVVEGPAMAARLEGLGCPGDAIRVARLPADAGELAFVQRRPADEFTVAVAGRFAEKKGFDLAIEAFARAFSKHGDVKLLMVGGGPLEGDYRRLVAELGIEDRVEWTGRLPHREFMRSLATAHVALYPSRTAANGDSEGGAPVTLIEAQWLGVPAIVSTHDDLPFVVPPDGATVLPERDVNVWADALRALYEQPARLNEMGEIAQEFARANHSLEGNALAREAIYREALT